jgi:hypothetical protein
MTESQLRINYKKLEVCFKEQVEDDNEQWKMIAIAQYRLNLVFDKGTPLVLLIGRCD